MVEETWEILELLGVDRQRLHLKWISASEGVIFAEEMRAFVARIKELGKNPFPQTETPQIEAAEAASS